MIRIIKICAGYSTAFACIFVVLATFGGNRFFTQLLAETTGVRISPEYTGGKVVRTEPRSGYDAVFHEPVFPGLFSPGKKGFVQIDYTGNTPERLTDTIDFDGDKKTDAVIEIDFKTKSAKVSPELKIVQPSASVKKLKKGYAVRIKLLRE